MQVNVGQVKLPSGKTIPGNKFGAANDSSEQLELSEAERATAAVVADVWKGILNLTDITDATDFFACGAGSMDVTRLVEEASRAMFTVML